jgi:hypothetical protein
MNTRLFSGYCMSVLFSRARHTGARLTFVTAIHFSNLPLFLQPFSTRSVVESADKEAMRRRREAAQRARHEQFRCYAIDRRISPRESHIICTNAPSPPPQRRPPVAVAFAVTRGRQAVQPPAQVVTSRIMAAE